MLSGEVFLLERLSITNPYQLRLPSLIVQLLWMRNYVHDSIRIELLGLCRTLGMLRSHVYARAVITPGVARSEVVRAIC